MSRSAERRPGSRENVIAARVPERVRVHPLDGPLRGTVKVPGDKSLSHRAFILGALADGPVEVAGAAGSQDVRATVAALRSMGARIRGGIGEAVVEGPLREPDDVLDCGNSGTAMRLLAGVCATVPGLSVLTGDASLRRRPMDRVAEPLRQMGVRVEGRVGGAYAPLAVTGGAVRAISYVAPVASAQVKSCVLLAALAADGQTTVHEPGASRDHTERMLRWLGARVESGDGAVRLSPGPLAARPLRVAADPSSAAFWLVAAAVLDGSDVRCTDLCLNPTRTGVLDVLQAMGARVDAHADREWSGEPVGDVRVAGGTLGGALVSGDLVVRTIDELPVLAVAGALGGGLEVRDAAELRVKEVDRIDAVVGMLRALGGQAEPAADGFRVPGGQVLAGGSVDSHGDHRLAMAAAVAALAASGPVEIATFGAVATSYPTFLEDLSRLGGRWEAAGEATGEAGAGGPA